MQRYWRGSGNGTQAKRDINQNGNIVRNSPWNSDKNRDKDRDRDEERDKKIKSLMDCDS